ncbi:MAG: hypothetical protein K5768_06960 [Firmicutes bacterium]|nr:hypothetical protein [Bacillota bacterium]
MGTKVCIIGAGSAIFSINLIKDLCINEYFKDDSTVVLVDIDEDRLNAIYGLCERYIKELNSNIKVYKTKDRREAMKDADFVLNVALDGGHNRFKQGIEVAYKNGYRFGGSLHVLHDEAFFINFHQLRLMEDILKDMLEICPDAYYILVANPVQAGVTYLKRKYKNAKIVGMCHGYYGVYQLAKALGMDKDDIGFEICGVNHFIWLTSFRYKGQNGYDILNKWLEEHDGYLLRGDALSDFGLAADEISKKAVEQYKKFGLFPIGDTPSSGGGAWGWEYHTDDEIEERHQCTPYKWYQNYFNECERNIAKLKNIVEDKSIKVSDIYSTQASPEPMIPLMEGLAFDTDTKVVVNILNDGGYMKGLPTDYEVEITARVDKNGIHPIHNNGLPKPIMAHLLRDRIAPVEVELAAFENHSLELLTDLVMMDPWTHSRKQAEKLISDIFSLPCNADMKEYYK